MPHKVFFSLSLWLFPILTQGGTVTNLDDAGPGSLRQVIADAITNETITIDPALENGIILLNSGEIEITQTLILNLGTLTIDAQNLSQIFVVTDTGNLTLQGSILINGRADFGGAILNEGNLRLTDTTLRNSRANERGGAIYNDGPAIFTNVTLFDNSAENHAGAIYNEDTLRIENSTLRNNTSSTRGGAIRNTGDLTLTSCYLFENNSQSSGGAIRNDGTLTINQSTIANNQSMSSGGGVFSEGTITITNTTVAHNSATGEGGGIFSDGTITAESITVTENESSFEGGGISIRSADTLLLTNSIVAGNFTEQGATNFAGIFDDDSENNLTSGIPLLAPLANYGGNTPTMPPFPDSPVIGSNGTTTLATDQRGGVRIQGNGLDLGATEAGGTPALIENPIVTTTNDELDHVSPIDLTSLSLREAITYGSAGSTISFALADSVSTFPINLGQLQISRNLTINGPNVGNLSFNLNAGDQSRILYLPSEITATINRLSFFNGDTSSQRLTIGAGILNFGTLTLNDCALGANSTTTEGGGIFSAGNLTLNRCQIQNNSADFAGGGLNNIGICEIEKCVFILNESERFGGAIRNSGTLTVRDTEFTSNQTTSANDTGEGGGAIRNSTGAALSIESSLFNNNRSSTQGGALFNSNSGTIDIQNTTFTANTGTSGGAIFNSSNGGLINLLHATLNLNRASDAGGAIFSEASPSNLQSINSIVASNMAPNDENISGDLTTESSNNFTTGDPMLEALANNRGPTFTMRPVENSPVLNAGISSSLLTDQRGFPRSSDLAPDLGAFEEQVAPTNLEADSDNDGLADGVEYAIGRDPFSVDPAAGQSLALLSENIRFGLNPASEDNVILTLTRSEDLEDFTEIILSNEDMTLTEELTNGFILAVDDQASTTPKAFYRLETRRRPRLAN